MSHAIWSRSLVSLIPPCSISGPPPLRFLGVGYIYLNVIYSVEPVAALDANDTRVYD